MTAVQEHTGQKIGQNFYKKYILFFKINGLREVSCGQKRPYKVWIACVLTGESVEALNGCDGMPSIISFK